MLFLFFQQWMEALNIRHEIKAGSLNISRALDTVWPPCSPALSFKLSAYGIQSQFHSWNTDSLHTHSQCVALNGTLSSSLPVKTGVPQGSVPGHILFLIFINYLTCSMENPLYLFAADATLCRDSPHPSESQTGSSLFHLLRP